MNLRQKTPFFQALGAKLIQKRQLPTYNDIIRHYTFLNDTEKDNKVVKNKTVEELEIIWKSASIPIMSTRHIHRKLEVLLVKVVKLKKLQHGQTFESLLTPMIVYSTLLNANLDAIVRK